MKAFHHAVAKTRAEHRAVRRALKLNRISIALRTVNKILIVFFTEMNFRFCFDGFRQNILKLFAADVMLSARCRGYGKAFGFSEFYKVAVVFHFNILHFWFL